MKDFSRKRTRKHPAINVTSLIDVMFMLVLFFMLTSSFVRPSIRISLPEAGNREKTEKQNLVVSVSGDERVYLDSREVAVDSLEDEIRREVGARPGSRLLFQGDENIRYSIFVRVMDIMKRTGVKEVNVVHRN